MEANLEENYTKTLEIKNEIFRITQPKSPVFSDVKVQNESVKDKFCEYIELNEAMQLDKRLSLIGDTIIECKNCIKKHENELRTSNDYEDKIYCLWVLDGKSVKEIMNIVCYQKTTVYEAIKHIKEQIDT